MNNNVALQYLQSTYNAIQICDPLWKNIPLLPELEPLLHSDAMQRLHRLRQLGPTYLVYPGATHTRYSHSLGVYHIARLILIQLLSQANCPNISIDECKCFLAAALLHDIGHFPYTHSLKELDLPAHEQNSANIITNELHDILQEKGIDPLFTAAIIHNSDTSFTNTPTLQLFNVLLSDAMDPDKLDYLCRDALFTGVPYGIQDIYFAIQQIVITEQGKIYFQSTTPQENILFSKYMMYHNVYWHSQVRSATAMVKKALHYGLTSQYILPKDLINSDDNQLITLGNKLPFPYNTLISHVHKGRLFQEIWISPYKKSFDQLILLETRENIEQEMAKQLSTDLVVIDIPEKITFEVINNQESVFTEQLIQKFTSNLRKIRVFVDVKFTCVSNTMQTISAIFDKIT